MVVSLTTMNLDEFAKSLLARFKPVAFYRFDDEEFAKYKQVGFHWSEACIDRAIPERVRGVDEYKSWGTA
mgnify:FL=1